MIEKELVEMIRDKPKRILKKIECKDGTAISVQASQYHYCSPREDSAWWYEVEVGFPTVEPSAEWEKYFDGDWQTEDRCGSVYGYVPIGLVVEYINSHGGMVTDDSV